MGVADILRYGAAVPPRRLSVSEVRGVDKQSVCEAALGLVIERYAMQKQLAEAKNDLAACAKKIEELNAVNKTLDDEVTRLREACQCPT